MRTRPRASSRAMTNRSEIAATAIARHSPVVGQDADYHRSENPRMRIAVLCDIHGNLPALLAVLAEVEKAGVDLVVFGGDVAAGPMPVETIEVLAAYSGPARFVRGNADRRMVESFDGAPKGGN